MIANTATLLKDLKSSDTESTGSKNSTSNGGFKNRLNSVKLSGDRENERLPVGAFGSSAAKMSVGPVENSVPQKKFR